MFSFRSRQPCRVVARLVTAAVCVGLLTACLDTPSEPLPPLSPDASVVPQGIDLEPFAEYLGSAAYRLYWAQAHPGTSSSALNAALRTSLSLGASAASGGPKIADGADVLVNDPAAPGRLQSEATLAVFGDVIVVGWNDGIGFLADHFDAGVTGWGVSMDGGRTFVDGGSLPRLEPEGFRHAGDPALAVDQFGTFFFADMCVEHSSPSLFAQIIRSSLCVTRGTAAGGTIAWQRPVLAATSTVDFLDKEFIAVDPSGFHVYVCYTRFSDDLVPGTSGRGQIELVASHDGGMTWGSPVVLEPEDPDRINQGCDVAVGPSGEVYVAWEHDWDGPVPIIRASRSIDQGTTFAPSVDIAMISSMRNFPPSGFNRPRFDDFPRLDVARSGPYRGRVYVTFHSRIAGTADVYLSYSDGGLSWSAPVRVNDDATDLQFWPTVFVEPGGNVDVMWMDRRDHPGTGLTHVYWAQSMDGGVTFRPNQRLSDVASNWIGVDAGAVPNMGDYNDIATSGNRTFAVWGDARNGNPDVYFSELRSVGKANR